MSPEASPVLSVVIPAYNEGDRLGPTLEKVLAFLEARPESFEVVVADDGSTDATGAIAESYAGRQVRVASLETNRGKGAALRAGVLASRGERVLVSDADLSTPIEDLERLEPRLAEAELVLGSRAVEGAHITLRQPIYRELMGKTFNLVIRLLGVRGVRDTQCGFKLLRGPVARELFSLLTVDRFAFDVELVWLARRRGYRVVEVGVTWANSPASKVHPVLDSLSMLRDVMRFRLRHRGSPPEDRAG